jgi:hypothetical protein
MAALLAYNGQREPYKQALAARYRDEQQSAALVSMWQACIAVFLARHRSLRSLDEQQLHHLQRVLDSTINASCAVVNNAQRAVNQLECRILRVVHASRRDLAGVAA